MACACDPILARNSHNIYTGGRAPITLVPNCRSKPSFVVCSIGGIMTPPLLKRTSSRDSLLRWGRIPGEMTYDQDD